MLCIIIVCVCDLHYVIFTSLIALYNVYIVYINYYITVYISIYITTIIMLITSIQYYKHIYRGVNQVAFHTDGAAVASAGQDKSINIWDIRSRQLVQHYSAHTDSVSSISFHPVCDLYCVCCVYVNSV